MRKKNENVAKDRRSGFYVLLVIGVLAVGGLAVFVLPQKSYSEMENRYLTILPQISVEGILSGEVQRDLTEMANDQFPMRDLWMKIATTGEYLLYRREVNGVYIGKDNYLFDKIVDSDLSQKNYETNLGYITALKAATDADVSVMLIPTAGTVLTDKLPKRAVLYDSAAYEATGEMLCEADSVRWIQTRDALTRVARDGLRRIYFHTDHHWTTEGAYEGAAVYLAAQGIQLAPQESFELQTVSKDFYGTLYSKAAGLPGARPDELALPQALPDELVIETDGVPADALNENGEKALPELTGIYDLSKLTAKDKYAVYFGGNYGKLTIRNPQAAGKGTLLIFKDSYVNSMVPYLLDNYEQITMIDLRYFNESVPALISHDWDEVLVCYELSNFIKDRNLFKLIR